MKHPIEELSIDQYRARYGSRLPAARRPALPRAARGARTGLTTLLDRGWQYTWMPALGYELRRGEMSTGWCASEAVACARARELAWMVEGIR